MLSFLKKNKIKTAKKKKKEFYGRIGKKLTIGMLFITIIPFGIIGYASYIYTSGILIEDAFHELGHNLDTSANKINIIRGRVNDDLLFLSKTPPIQGIIRAQNGDGVDPLDGSTDTEWKNRLTAIFEGVAYPRDIYLQVRYIDENGQELVRVDSDGDGTVRVPTQLLQNKANRYYFTETMKLGLGELFVSPIDLNREGSPPRIEVPYQPVIRYSTPVFDEITRTPKGMIIINVRVKHFLDDFGTDTQEDKFGDDIGDGFIVDNNGYYILHTDKSREWGSYVDLGTGENIKKDLPEEITSAILSGESGIFEVLEDNHVIAYRPVFLDLADTETFIVIYKFVQRDVILAPILILRNILLWTSFIFVLFVAVFSVIFSLSISRPLVKLTEAVQAISAGDMSVRSSIKSKDELGMLSKAFNKMAENILEARSTLEEKVTSRTEELKKGNKALEKQKYAILNILDDIEKEKRNVLEEKDRINTILHSIGDGVVVLDKEAKVFIVNDTASELSNYKKEEFIGSLYYDVLRFVYEKDGSGRNFFIQDCLRGGNINKLPQYSALMKKDGTLLPVSAIASPLNDMSGKIIGCVIVFRDTEKEREIDKSKSEFVSLASHQLRTPLSTINWYTEMLLAGDAGKINDQQREFLNEIYTGGLRMADLVNALLNVSRLELGTFIVEPELLDITEISKNAIGDLAALLKSKNIKIIENYGEIPKINIDKKLVHIIFQNLLSNAVKYSPNDSTVRISIVKKANGVYIEIADNGIGIPQDQQDNVFTKLFRADNVKESDTTGTGLGLYITKSILDHSGGKISFESTENKGTIFKVSIPLKGMSKKTGERALN